MITAYAPDHWSGGFAGGKPGGVRVHLLPPMTAAIASVVSSGYIATIYATYPYRASKYLLFSEIAFSSPWGEQ